MIFSQSIIIDLSTCLHLYQPVEWKELMYWIDIVALEYNWFPVVRPKGDLGAMLIENWNVLHVLVDLPGFPVDVVKR